MGQLYKSDTKGVYLDIGEIHDAHLERIIEKIEERYQLLISTLRQHYQKEVTSCAKNNDAALWKRALDEATLEGPGFMTKGLGDSTWATYQDLIDERRMRAEARKKEAMRLDATLLNKLSE